MGDRKLGGLQLGGCLVFPVRREPPFEGLFSERAWTWGPVPHLCMLGVRLRQGWVRSWDTPGGSLDGGRWGRASCWSGFGKRAPRGRYRVSRGTPCCPFQGRSLGQSLLCGCQWLPEHSARAQDPCVGLGGSRTVLDTAPPHWGDPHFCRGYRKPLQSGCRVGQGGPGSPREVKRNGEKVGLVGWDPRKGIKSGEQRLGEAPREVGTVPMGVEKGSPSQVPVLPGGQVNRRGDVTG